MRLPMNMKGTLKEGLGDREGELVIDESRGHDTSSFPTTPYNEPRPTPTPTPTCYEQIGHNFGNKPSSSTLSLLASAASKNNNKGPQHRFHPYLRLKEHDEFLSAYYPTSSIVHSNGIWTPSAAAMASAPSNPSSVYEQQHSSSPYEGYPQLPPNEQIVALTSSTSAGVEASSPFLYEHTNNNNNYHQQEGGQYKNETSSSSSPPPLVSQYTSRESPVPVDTLIKNSFFTQAQVDTLCDVMLRDKNFEMLVHILHRLPKDIDKTSENILRARAALARKNKNYEELYKILNARTFSLDHHKELQDLYQSARYSEAEAVRGRPLGAVDKYRIRRKHTLPMTIWDGEATSYTFKERDRKVLLEAFNRERFPSAGTKTELMALTKLNKRQIDNWFKNRRQRDRSADKKTPKSKRGGNYSDRYANTPASSSGSGSTMIYANMPYQSPPTGEESMDIKYSPYLQGTSPPDLSPSPSYPQRNKGRERANSGNVAHAVAWAKGAAALVGEKVKRGAKKANKNFSSQSAPEGENIYVYPELYMGVAGGSCNRNRSSPASTIILNVSSGGGGGTEGGGESPSNNFHNHNQQYSSPLLNHHHHQSGGLGLGWTSSGWHAAGGINTGNGNESPSYSSLNILPSLAATFNHHSHHHGITTEPRIQVQ